MARSPRDIARSRLRRARHPRFQHKCGAPQGSRSCVGADRPHYQSRCGPASMGGSPITAGGGLINTDAPLVPMAPASSPVARRSWYRSMPYQIVMWGSGLTAAGLSYAKNKSLGWAFAHSLVGPAYLVYRGAEHYKSKD